MSGRMSTGLKQGQAGQEFGISLNEPIAQGRMIPVRTGGSKAGVSASRQFIVLALNDEFSLRKGIVVARVVHIEMGTDEHIDVVRSQAKIGEMLDHIFLLLGWWHSRRQLDIRRKSAVNEDVLAITGLDEIATQDHFQRSVCYWYGRD